MSDLRELYQELILDHGRKPRNHERLDSATCQAEGHNPMCGDRFVVYVAFDGDRIRRVAFEGMGCAISQASASLMTETLAGRTVPEALETLEQFHDLVTGKTGDEPDAERLGKLIVFTGVRDFPVRVKCATLAWHTLRAALERSQAQVTTE